jgi:hypothetical protein
MTHECRFGYRRVRLCMRKDLFRALVLIELEGVKRYKIVEDALLMYLDSKRSVGGFRVLTVSEDLYNELTVLGDGDPVEGIRKLLEYYRQKQQPQSQVGLSQAQGQVQVMQTGVDFLDNNPWVEVIRNRHTATSTPSREF